jgi:uncharacterized protein DUF5648
MRSTVAVLLAAIAGVLCALTAHATFHTFVLNEIYSNADGTVQFVELREAQGATGQNFFAGIRLVSGGGASQQTFTFPGNLPSFNTAGKFVLIATQGFADLNIVAPDYIVPNNFLFQPSGSINFADVDFVSYTQLPGDGSTSINRNGVPGTNSPRNFAGETGTVPGLGNDVTEFHNTLLNHYFLTANPIEAMSIDAGASGPGWSRTGGRFKSGGSNAVCRFFGVQSAGGPNGHFYTADPAECEQVKRDPGWRFESLDFSITPTNPGGVCPAGLANIYRAYNNRFAQRDSNHRITADFSAYQTQIALGWTGEGVVMCAQP